ncbi:Hypothetical protein (Fragment) [Durusdinium trenchii]|uniref:Uncharacterized protein n=1 Tax=Durusdinium trenchii TaxID=1381693 RepID=A0ABP0J7T2_9DINO
MRVNISSTAVGPTRLRLLIGRQGSVPLPTESFRSQVEFFETSFGTIETGPAGEYHWPGPELNLTEAVLDIISPRTFLLPSTSFMVRLSLEIPEGSSAPTSFLIMARPFTSWSLHPPAASVIAPGQEDQTASCVNDIRLSPMIDFRCYWTSFGQDGRRLSANGVKLIFDILPLTSLSLEFSVSSPALGSFEKWLVVALEGDGRATLNSSQPARAVSQSAHGILVQAAPTTEVLSYTSSAISTLNTLRVRVIPGITIHGQSTQTLDLGYLRIYLPTVMGQMRSCQLEPLEAWSGSISFAESFLTQLNSEEKTCSIIASSPSLHFYAQSSYFIVVSFYNAPIPFRGDEYAWTLELRAPQSAALSFPIPPPFDVVSAFTLFRVRMSRLAVSQSQNLDQLGLVRIDFQLAGESEGYESDEPVLCLLVRPPTGFYLGDGPACPSFQIHTGLPATTCTVQGLSMSLSFSSRLVPGVQMAFSIGLWNPTAGFVLQGYDTLSWAMESRYSSCAAGGRLHAQRVGQSSPFGSWPQILYPLSLDISRISASSMTVGSEASIKVHFVLPVPVQAGSRLLVSAPYEWKETSNIETSAALTGASASWTLQLPEKADHATELLMEVDAPGLLSLVTYGFVATVIHPVTVHLEDPPWWSLEVFGSVSFGKGYREDPTTLLPFDTRFAAGTVPGYSLRRLRECEVIPWRNEIGGSSPVLLRFFVTVAIERTLVVPVLVVSPPLAFSFTQPCEALAPRPSSAEMSRQPLEGICKNNPTNTKVWVEISESVAAFVPYVLEIWSLQAGRDKDAQGGICDMVL